MPIAIEMPKLSDTMTEGTLVRWIKKVGDTVAVGDVLAEVETDKATMEMEAFDDGVLTEIYVQGRREGLKSAKSWLSWRAKTRNRLDRNKTCLKRRKRHANKQANQPPRRLKNLKRQPKAPNAETEPSKDQRGR